MRQAISSANAYQLRELAQVKCGWITQVAWSPVTNALAVACANVVRLYVNTFGGAPTMTLEGHDSHVKGVAFSPDGHHLATVSADTTLKLWDISRQHPQLIRVFEGHTSSVEAVAFSPDGRLIVTGSADTTVRIWDAHTGAEFEAFRGHTAEVTSVDFLLQGNLIVSGSWDKTVRLWDVANETGGTVHSQHEDWVRHIAANSAGTMFASASKDGTVYLWDTYEENPYAHILAHENGCDAVVFQTDGRLLATGGRDNMVRLWNVDQLIREGRADPSRALATLTGHERPVLSVAFNATGTLLATASGDNTVRLWSVG